jgi:hypothetical protein
MTKIRLGARTFWAGSALCHKKSAPTHDSNYLAPSLLLWLSTTGENVNRHHYLVNPPTARWTYTVRPQKSYFFPRLKNQTKRVCIEMQLGTYSVNTPKNIFNFKKVYATVTPFPLQPLDHVIPFSRDLWWRRVKHQEKDAYVKDGQIGLLTFIPLSHYL